MTPTSRNIAVIGGGWAGVSAAADLVKDAHRVTLFEAARTLGGRARAIEVNGQTLDNGQHILLGAYDATLKLMRRVGVDAQQALLRLPLQMRYPPHSDGMDFIASRLPAPFHLISAVMGARGLTRHDKLAIARFFTSMRWMGWQLHRDCSVSDLIARHDQSERLIALLWRPLCIAALNTPPDQASAKVFLNVLRDALDRGRQASDMLIPRVDLTTLLPQAVARTVVEQRGTIRLGTRVEALVDDDAGWKLRIAGTIDEQVFDDVIIATDPMTASTLLDGHINVSALRAFTFEPITTCYLQYASDVTIGAPFYALRDDASSQRWGQFVFDRGVIDGTAAGLLAVVVSTSSEAIAEGNEKLSESIAKQLAHDFQRPVLALPAWTKVISEKRATFRCTPDLLRPSNATGRDGLWLAGDYTASDYPATLESAVRSGSLAAQCIRQAAAK